MAYDVAAVRSHYPALASGEVFFDGPGGTQVPQPVVDAVSRTLAGPLSNRSPHSRPQRAADERRRRRAGGARRPAGGRPGRHRLRPQHDRADVRPVAHPRAAMGPGDEVVVSRLDHDANVRPWVQAAERVGATVRWIDFDLETGELRPDHLAAVLGDAHPAGGGHRGVQRARHPPRRARPGRPGPRGRCAAVRRRRPPRLALRRRRRGARRRLLRLLPLQVRRPALRRAGRGPGAARGAPPRQAAARRPTRSRSGSSSARSPTS